MCCLLIVEVEDFCFNMLSVFGRY